ncbi:hypothetical protein Tco_1132946 [Tanacetum coccineum]|uniref:Synaptobrevin, longin-like domain protein n=1 Tax=Tanacetum coccineum TaxID=301880 RepID=A0ABQ5JF08_9ASTR
MVACLEKSEGNSNFHEIVDFLTANIVHYALTVSPTIYASYIEQFWNTTHSQIVNDVKQIHTTVDGKTVVISESSVKSDLHFNDEDGITCLTNDAFFENFALMGYESDSNKLTFQKALFSPQWKYLIHTILHCLSSKSTSWNEFSTNIASAVICLANGQKFNFSKLIFDGMLRNLDTNTKKFLMYPRFLQLFLNNQITLAEPFNDVYQTPAHTKKVFTNMKRKGKDFSGRVTPLFASMLAPPVVEGEGSGQPTEPQPAPSTTQPRIEEQIPVTESSSPQNTQSPRQALQEDTQLPQTSVPIPNVADEAVFKEWDDRVVRATTTAASLDAAQASGNISKTQSTAMSNDPLSQEIGSGDRVLALEQSKTAQDLVIRKLKKKVRKLEKKLRARNYKDENFKLGDLQEKVLDVVMQWRMLKVDFDTLGRNNSLVQDEGISWFQEDAEIQGRNSADTEILLDQEEPTELVEDLGSGEKDTTSDDLTLTKTLMEIRKSKDKGKAKMDEIESLKKMKQRQQIQISRDEEVAQKLQEEFDATERQRMAQVHQTAQGFIDAEWDDVLARVIADEDFVQQLQVAKRNKPMTPAQQKDYMSNYIKNQEGGYSIKQLKSLSFEQVKEIFETTMRRVQSFVPMDSELEVQRLKRAGSGEEQSAEKEKELSEEELHKLLVIVPVIIRVGNHTKAYQIFADMLKKFDRDDLVKLWDLVKERFSTTEPTDDKEKELWVELKRLFEPDNDDILWKLQRYMHDPLVWRLYDTCGVHHVSSVRGHDIFMLVEKEYPLSKGVLMLMLVNKLLVEADSQMSRELLRKIFIQANRSRQVEFFKDWKPLSPLQLAVEEVMSE